jgi:hypothetical protein
MLLIYCLLYAVGDFLRALFYKSDTSTNAVGLAVYFWLLSIWLVIDAVVYYKAFMIEQQTLQPDRLPVAASRNSSDSAGTELSAIQPSIESSELRTHTPENIAQVQEANPSPSRKPIHSSGGGDPEPYHKWTYWLNTTGGLAYFLNIRKLQLETTTRHAERNNWGTQFHGASLCFFFRVNLRN